MKGSLQLSKEWDVPRSTICDHYKLALRDGLDVEHIFSSKENYLEYAGKITGDGRENKAIKLSNLESNIELDTELRKLMEGDQTTRNLRDQLNNSLKYITNAELEARKLGEVVDFKILMDMKLQVTSKLIALKRASNDEENKDTQTITIEKHESELNKFRDSIIYSFSGLVTRLAQDIFLLKTPEDAFSLLDNAFIESLDLAEKNHEKFKDT